MQKECPYPIGKNRNRCTRIYFHLASKHCQNTTLVMQCYVNGVAHEIKMLCVQQGAKAKKYDFCFALNVSY